MTQWDELERLFIAARCAVSNTADRGYETYLADRPDAAPPRSFPAKLAKLLLARHRAGAKPITLFACELTPDNGKVLRGAVLDVLDRWQSPADARLWVEQDCIWVNSLVDRIVSEPLEPLGAVAEPYALWAIEDQSGLQLPCRHAAIVVAPDLKPYERLKLFILNLGHTYLAELWAKEGGAPGLTVREAVADTRMRARLDGLYEEEVLPVFAAIGMGDEAQAYLKTVIERFSNPFLNHRLSEIFTNHEAKKQRRFGGLIELAEERTTCGSSNRASRPRSPTAASMTHDPLASSDVIAERRFAYAKAVAKGGDLSAAADLFEQALERAPSWAAAWFALGETREKLGDLDGAAAAFGATVAVDPADAHGAAARLALIGHRGVPNVLPQAYVARLFDDYAPRFDKHLTKNLFYRGPALIGAALDAVAPGRRFASAVDLGCGTGLVGEALRGRIDYLTGVDLSPAMIAKARERGVYDRLIVGDATALLMCEPLGVFDLIVAADALVYVGDLAPLFDAAGPALVADGLFAFSVETFVGDGFRLEPTMRFAHARSYVEATASDSGLRPLLVQSAWARREAGADVPGLICVFETAERRNGAEGSRAASG